VTAPINKVSFRLGGWGKRFIGHTEMLAELTGSKEVGLMLVHGSLRAIHVTSHVPLKAVPALITRRRVTGSIRLADLGVRMMGIRGPRIAVCGLNPHAGDGGLMGHEEERAIAPAVAACRREGLRVDGPLPADTVWPFILAGRYDVAVAMYHDQGQIPIKMHGFRVGKNVTQSGGVNVTIGLPIIRTSPAHGTAFDIAGKGLASEESFVEALTLAARMVSSR
jgi:4-hydroxythreonine-4-phosphate dehydrogenase